MPDMSDLSLSELDRRRLEVRDFLRGRTRPDSFINKHICPGHVTEKAFALFYLGPSLLQGFDTLLDQATIQELEHQLESQEKEILKLGIQSITTTDISKFPNSYASAVVLAGYLKVVNGSEEPRKLSKSEAPVPQKSVDQAIEVVVQWMTAQIDKSQGFVPSLYSENQRASDGRDANEPDKKQDVTPSSYLTFWCAAALCQWRHYLKDRNRSESEELCDGRQKLVSWSARRLRDMLAFHHGGLRPQFDVVEIAYAAATLLMASEASDDRILVQHALLVLFQSYFNFGCLEASAPVFSDINNNESVQISTAEVLATISLADHLGKIFLAGRLPKVFLEARAVLIPHLSYVQDTYNWLRDHGGHVRGWFPEGQGRPRANAYATASATRVLGDYAAMLEDTLDRKVRLNLDIEPFAFNSKLQDVAYPGDLGPLFQQTIFDPIKSRKRSIASYSMVLYGPPGTSKTTIAKRIAQSLGWPLKQFGTGSFLQKGRTGIDQAAAEIFEALRYLRDVVVLFDEVEELVGEREEQASMESRLLTTAMLPRLQDLRDRREIVFILATNRVERIDAAIRRLGRFDIVRCVLPPSPPEQKLMLDKLVQDYNLTPEVKDYVSQHEVAEGSDNFCYGDLDAFVRELAIAQATGKCTKTFIKRAFEHARSRALSDDQLKPYLESKKKIDRPGIRTTKP
jgi:ATPase family protein associated with various cellular activities (AAA)